MRHMVLTQSTFRSATEAWLQSRKPYLRPKTIHEYELSIKPLNNFFESARLLKIDADMIRAYQKMRLEKGGPYAVNHECSILQQMLKAVGRWAEIAPDYRPVPLPREKRGRALSDTEKERLLRIANTNPEWQAAYLFAAISVNTSAGPKEVATLRFKDVFLDRPAILIQPEGAKNSSRHRIIPLNDEALSAVKSAMERARKLGATEPEHYLFPATVRYHRHSYNPARYQGSFKTAWKKMTEAAQLGGTRMYDLRHTFITKALENPTVSEASIEDVVGHIRAETKKKYSHIRFEKMKQVVDVMCKKPQQREPAKKKPKSEASADPELIRELLLALKQLVKRG